MFKILLFKNEIDKKYNNCVGEVFSNAAPYVGTKIRITLRQNKECTGTFKVKDAIFVSSLFETKIQTVLVAI